MTPSTARAQEIAAFYVRYASRLQRIVSAKVNAPAQTIEDACQNAWAMLLRREDVTLDERGAAWLATVAIREGWRLTRCGEVPATAMRPGMPESPGLAADEPAADEQALARIEHAERVADLRTPKESERRALYLTALGYSYNEISRLSRGVRVNVAVLLGADVGDMSLMERRGCRSSVPRPRAARGCCSCLNGAAHLARRERETRRLTSPPRAAARSSRDSVRSVAAALRR